MQTNASGVCEKAHSSQVDLRMEHIRARFGSSRFSNRGHMLNRVLVLLLSAVVLSGCGSGDVHGADASGDEVFSRAYNDHTSGLQVTGTGTVTRVLPDDNDGGRHQRFIVELSSGQTLLIAHNIDAAPRIDSLIPGDAVEFSGVYEWNDEGGVVHWTHHDPDGVHQPGWLKHDGALYQ